MKIRVDQRWESPSGVKARIILLPNGVLGLTIKDDDEFAPITYHPWSCSDCSHERIGQPNEHFYGAEMIRKTFSGGLSYGPWRWLDGPSPYDGPCANCSGTAAEDDYLCEGCREPI